MSEEQVPESIRALAARYRRIPVWKSIPAIRGPLQVFLALKNLSRQCFILESLEDPERWGRYTFIGYDPKLEFTCRDGQVTIRNGSSISFECASPGAEIARIIEENRSPQLPELPPFAGGLVGYFSFDWIKYGEKSLASAGVDTEGFRDADLMLFDKLVIFDNLEKKIILVSNMGTDALEENYRRALRDLDSLETAVQTGITMTPARLGIRSPFRALFTRQEYCAMVEQAQQHIREGDIFQVVLSNRLDADVEGSLFDTYAHLRQINPSPYMFYFSSDDIEIAGASPETLVKLQDGTLYTFPLAGTRPRGATAVEDAALEAELLADPKELAEHNMLVDLGRNDLGRISRFGSVEVEKYLSVERFSHVMHLGSTVHGAIQEGKGAIDAINAVLPAGTLSGAPKIRACEIINRLENNRRGLYGGAIGYIAFTGNMDTCIAIRLAWKKNGKVFVRSGAGIVADSVPEREYEECGSKMKAVVRALEIAAGSSISLEDKA